MEMSSELELAESWKVWELLQALPCGYSEVEYQQRRYGLSKSVYNQGRSLKLFAEELGGTDFVSLNYYITKSGHYLKPCEMPREKVVAFLTGLSLIFSGRPARS